VTINAPLLTVAVYSIFYTLFLDPVAGLSWTACVGYPLYRTALIFAVVSPYMCVAKCVPVPGQRNEYMLWASFHDIHKGAVLPHES